MREKAWREGCGATAYSEGGHVGLVAFFCAHSDWGGCASALREEGGALLVEVYVEVHVLNVVLDAHGN